jgi:hypothetical protein
MPRIRATCALRDFLFVPLGMVGLNDRYAGHSKSDASRDSRHCRQLGKINDILGSKIGLWSPNYFCCGIRNPRFCVSDKAIVTHLFENTLQVRFSS